MTFLQNDIQLSKVGNRYKGNCPFHDEKTPSFFVFPDTNSYHCFGCKASGDAIDYLMRRNKLTFKASVETLARQVGLIHLLADSAVVDKRKRERERYVHVMTLAKGFFIHQLKNTPAGSHAASILQTRGLSQETVDKFQLGFAPDSWNALKTYLNKARIKDDEAFEAGLVAESRQKPGSFYDFYRSRIIFPIFDEYGRVVAFGGRTLDAEAKICKYLNTKETQCYRKGQVLYGLSLVKDEIKAKDFVYVVEGYMDQISLYQQGVRNVVACLGTALTIQSIMKLKAYTRRVYLLFDGDQAGVNAAEKSIAAVMHAGVEGHVIVLPENLDPEDYINRFGVEAFEKMKEDAVPIFEFLLKRKLKKYGASIEGKREIVKQFIPVFAAIIDRVRRHLFVKEFCESLGFDSQMIEREIFYHLKQGKPREPKLVGAEVQPHVIKPLLASEWVKKSVYHEFVLLVYQLDRLSPELLDELRFNEIVGTCSYEKVKILSKFLIECANQGGSGRAGECPYNLTGLTNDYLTDYLSKNDKIYAKDDQHVIKQLKALACKIDLERTELEKRQLIAFFKDVDKGQKGFLTKEHLHSEQRKKQQELMGLNQKISLLQQQLTHLKRNPTPLNALALDLCH